MLFVRPVNKTLVLAIIVSSVAETTTSFAGCSNLHLEVVSSKLGLEPWVRIWNSSLGKHADIHNM